MDDWRPYLLAGLALASLVAAAVYVNRPIDVSEAPARRGTGTVRPAPVVLITIDTLRADHVGWAGHFADTTPRMDGLAQGETVFTNAWAASGITTPSHVSLLTGLYPHQHGVLGNRQAEHAPFRSGEGVRTVAEVLAEDGYATGGFVSAAPVKRATGLAAGFQAWEEPRKPSWACGRTVSHVEEWLAGLDDDRFFLWVHLWEPHTPNHPAPPTLERFAGDQRYGALLDARQVDVDLVRRSTPGPLAHRFMPPAGDQPVDRQMLTGLLARYDADVRTVDGCVARVLEAVRERGVWDDAMVAITADHGQSLGQHGWLAHNSDKAPVLRVPLVIKLPEGLHAPARVDRVAAGVDVLPTLMARLDTPGARALVEQSAGRDLLDGQDRPGEALAKGSGDDWTLVAGRWKLNRPGNGRASLHDLHADPLELHDVAGDHRDVVARLGKRLDALLADRVRARDETGDRDSDLARELEALGYVE